MSEIPTKMYYIGKDVESLTREELIDVVRYLGREMESTRAITQSVINMERTFREVKSRYR